MRALRAINNLLAKAAISLAMFIVFLMVAALALSATTRFITGTGFAWFIELPPGNGELVSISITWSFIKARTTY